jgi:hypothetical protein
LRPITLFHRDGCSLSSSISPSQDVIAAVRSAFFLPLLIQNSEKANVPPVRRTAVVTHVHRAMEEKL